MIIDNACTPQTTTILHFWRKDNQTVMYMLMDYNYLKLMTKSHLQWGVFSKDSQSNRTPTNIWAKLLANHGNKYQLCSEDSK